MEAILKFNLPEEQDEFNTAVNGFKYKMIIHELKQYLRSEIKYNNELSQEVYDTLETVRDKIIALETDWLKEEI